MKISCFGSRVSCSFRRALRAAATSGRSCSAACTLFFKGQVDVAEEPRNPRLAHLHLFFRQANLKLCKRTIRLFRYKLLNPISMWFKRESLVPAELVWTDTARFALELLYEHIARPTANTRPERAGLPRRLCCFLALDQGCQRPPS